MRCFAAMFALVTASLAAHANDARPELVLRSESQVAGVWVRLGAIAHLGSIERRDPMLAKRLTEIPLAAVRLGSTPIVLSLRDVEMAVRRAAPGLIGKVTVDGNAKHVRVTPTMQQVPGRVLRDAAID